MAVHKQNVRRSKSDSNKPWKQFGITNTRVKKVKICQECMKVWTALIIPLFKSDSQTMRKFLRPQAISGAILKFSQLHDYYLCNMHQTQKAKLEELVRICKKRWLWMNSVMMTGDTYLMSLIAVFKILSKFNVDLVVFLVFNFLPIAVL